MKIINEASFYHRINRYINKRLLMNHRDLDNIYVHQTEQYGLGNFINLTPTMQLLANHLKRPVPVYFDLKFIRDCFTDCPFMEILEEEPDYNPLFTSGLVNFKNDCPDWLHVYKEVTKSIPLTGKIPHTYIDTAKEMDAPKVNTLFIRGSGNENKWYLASKMPSDSYYIEHFADNLSGEYSEAFTGSENDISRANGLFDRMIRYIGGVRLALALIREADYIVANDSGLAHAAGAMNKRMTVLWVNTSLPKNGNPGKHTNIKLCQ